MSDNPNISYEIVIPTSALIGESEGSKISRVHVIDAKDGHVLRTIDFDEVAHKEAVLNHYQIVLKRVVEHFAHLQSLDIEEANFILTPPDFLSALLGANEGQFDEAVFYASTIIERERTGFHGPRPGWTE